MPRHRTPWRHDPVILARLAEVEPRHLAGQPNTHIAAALGVDEKVIRNDLKRLSELWVERIGQQAETLRSQIAAELEDIRQRSLKAAAFDEMAERAVLFDDPDEKGSRVERPEKGGVSFKGGKAQALNTARQASMDKARLLGLVIERQEIDATIAPRVYEVQVPDRDSRLYRLPPASSDAG